MGVMLLVYTREQRWPSLREIGDRLNISKGGLLHRMQALMQQGRVTHDAQHHYRLPVPPSLCDRCTGVLVALEANQHEMSPEAYMAILKVLDEVKK